MVDFRRIGHTALNISPMFLIMLPVAAYLGVLKQFALVLFVSITHELGHVAAAALLGVRTYSVEILPVGLFARIEEKPGLSYASRILIFSAGPLVNFLWMLGAFIIWRFFSINHETYLFFLLLNGYLILINLLPAFPLDGGKILWTLLARSWGYAPAARRVCKITFALSILLVIAGLWQFISSRQNFSLLAIGIFLLFNIKKELDEIKIMGMKDLIYRKERILKKGVYPVRELVVSETVTVGELIKQMELDRYHIFRIIDENLNITDTLMEGVILDSMVHYGIHITVKELAEKIR